MSLAGNVLHSITASVWRLSANFKLLQYLCNGKWEEYGSIHRRGEKFPTKRAWSGSRGPFI